MMTDREVEELLQRYLPSEPRAELSQRILLPGDKPSLVLHVQREPAGRTWPWAVAAAVLLSIAVGVHATAVFAPPPPSRDVAEVADRLGGDPLAWTVARFIVAAPSEQSAVMRDPLQELR